MCAIMELEQFVFVSWTFQICRPRFFVHSDWSANVLITENMIFGKLQFLVNCSNFQKAMCWYKEKPSLVDTQVMLLPDLQWNPA